MCVCLLNIKTLLVRGVFAHQLSKTKNSNMTVVGFEQSLRNCTDTSKQIILSVLTTQMMVNTRNMSFPAKLNDGHVLIKTWRMTFNIATAVVSKWLNQRQQTELFKLIQSFCACYSRSVLWSDDKEVKSFNIDDDSITTLVDVFKCCTFTVSQIY